MSTDDRKSLPPEADYPSILNASTGSLRVRVAYSDAQLLEVRESGGKIGVTFFEGTPDGLEALARHLQHVAALARKRLADRGAVRVTATAATARPSVVANPSALN